MKEARAATSIPNDKAGPLAKEANCPISKSARTCNETIDLCSIFFHDAHPDSRHS